MQTFAEQYGESSSGWKKIRHLSNWRENIMRFPPSIQTFDKSLENSYLIFYLHKKNPEV